MNLEKWIEEFLDSGGQITVCKPQERRQTRFKSKHKGKLFPKAKKEPKRKLVVRKRQNGLTCEVTVKKVNPKRKETWNGRTERRSNQTDRRRSEESNPLNPQGQEGLFD